MAGIEEVARLIVEAEAKGFAETEQKIQRTEGSLAALTKGYQNGTYSLDYYMKRGAALQSKLDDLRDAFTMADEAVKKHGSTQAATAALTQQFSTASRGAQERTRGLAYAMNDFFAVSGGVQQRLNAIANNLPQLFAGLSPKLVTFGLALGGLAPIIGMVLANAPWDKFGQKADAILGGIVGSENWTLIKKRFVDAIEGAVKDAVPHLEALKAKIKELEEKPHKIDMDYIDLQHAREEADKIAEGLRVIEQLKKHQSKEEKESGGLVTEAVTSAQGGPEKFLADLTEQFRRELMATREKRPGELGVTDRQIKEKEEQIRRENRGAFSHDEAGRAGLEEYVRNNRDIKALEQKRAEQEADISKPGGIAEQEAGKAIAAARDKHGPDQETAQKELAKRARRAGHADVAEGLQSTKELEAYDKEAKEFEQRMQRATDAGARRRALEARKEKAQQVALDDLLKSNTFDEDADKAAKEVNKRGLTKLESFEALKAKIQADILESLRKQHKDADNAERVAAKAAAAEAERAFARVGMEGQKQTKAEDRKDKKDDKAAVNQWFDEQTHELAEWVKKNEAEAGRIQKREGKDAGDPFFFQALSADPTGDPQKIATKVAAKMVEYFTRSKNLGGLGATEGGAQVAAQRYAAQAGFRLSLPEIRAAGVGVARDARNPTAAAGRDERDQRTREARDRMNADREQRQEANKNLKRANPVPVARANPAGPKAPQPAPKAVPKPGGFHTPTQAEVDKRRDAERKAKAKPAPKPGGFHTPTQAEVDKRRDAERKAKAKPAPKPGGFHTPTQAEVDKRRDAERKAKAAQQPPVKKASVDKVVDLVAQNQATTSEGLAIDAQLATRLAVLERQAATNAGLSRQVLTRVSESGPTGSGTGWGTA